MTVEIAFFHQDMIMFMGFAIKFYVSITYYAQTINVITSQRQLVCLRLNFVDFSDKKHPLARGYTIPSAEQKSFAAKPLSITLRRRKWTRRNFYKKDLLVGLKEDVDNVRLRTCEIIEITYSHLFFSSGPQFLTNSFQVVPLSIRWSCASGETINGRDFSSKKRIIKS